MHRHPWSYAQATRKVLFKHSATLLALIHLGLAQAADAVAETTRAAPSPISETFRFKDGGEASSYSLRLGNDATANTVIFFISGSGCASIKHRLAPFFAPINTQISAMVFALQKRGIDEDNRAGKVCGPTFYKTDYVQQTITDQREYIDAQLSKLTQQPRTVIVLGASEGAVVAARLANIDRRITHLGLIGGGGSTVRENLIQLSRSKWYLRNPESGFEAIAHDPENTETKIWGQSYKYWASLLDIDIGAELIQLDIPIVAAIGEKDESVPVEAARELQTRFEGAGKTNFRLLVFPNADHRLEDKDTHASHAGEFLSELVKLAQPR